MVLKNRHLKLNSHYLLIFIQDMSHACLMCPTYTFHKWIHSLCRYLSPPTQNHLLMMYFYFPSLWPTFSLLLEEVIYSTWPRVDLKTEPEQSTASHLLFCLCNVLSAHHSHSQSYLKYTTWELYVLTLFGWYMWFNPVKTFKILVAECEDLLVLWLPKTNYKWKFLPVWSGLLLSSWFLSLPFM